ncbi:hypothetical protein MLD38_025167 [Melastoma candidum]|uniref:Uncharacterized protein n=1 Tax=Melastoma candidum TaxID=119954 RepID=A0ACB9NUL7_9MYRT|nr:hypothetical protein MLD38_025167 [Melastoma candidum]
MGTFSGIRLNLDSELEDREEAAVHIQEAVRLLLGLLGEDPDREGLMKTPLRVAKAFLHGTRGYRQNVVDIVQGAFFPEAGVGEGIGEAGGAGGLVVVRDLDLFSLCDSCLLPFHVKCHVGYIPSGQRVLGLSKLSRVAEVFAKRLQSPQRLAEEIASALQNTIDPTGVAVSLLCSHRNVEPIFVDYNSRGWAEVFVNAGSGVFEDKSSDAWNDFVSLLTLGGSNVNAPDMGSLGACECWFPMGSANSACVEEFDPRMTAAATSLLQSLGDDSMRKELAGTPARYLKWLTNFQNTNLPINLCNFDLRLVDPLEPKRIENGPGGQIHSELNLPFCALCEHHLLPFHGTVHIACIHAQGRNPPGRPLLQSVVDFYGFKLQVQERLTRQVAETVSPLLGGDIMVVVEASHCCMISRGIEKIGSSTATVAVLGRFSSDAALREKFLQCVG